MGEWAHQRKMLLLSFLMLQGDACCGRGMLLRGRLRLPLPVAKQRFHLPDDVFPVKFAGDGEKSLVGLVTGFPECAQILLPQGFYAFCRTERGTAQSCSR